MSELRTAFESGVPYELRSANDTLETAELQAKIGQALIGFVEAHQELQERRDRGDLVLFNDVADEAQNKYGALPCLDGAPAFQINDNLDVGMRICNPDYALPANVTTVQHCSERTYEHYKKQRVSKTLLRSLAATCDLYDTLKETVAIPALREYAVEADSDPDEMVDRYYSSSRADASLVRIIGYHAETDGATPPVSSDGKSLLIHEHNDKGDFTIDVKQTQNGLEYYNLETKQWQPASTEVAFFAGGALRDAELSGTLRPVAAFHRVVRLPYSQRQLNISDDLQKKLEEAGLTRIAIPMFINRQDPDAKKLTSSSNAVFTPQG